MKVQYQDLAAFGLPFLVRGGPEFDAALREILSGPATFLPSPAEDLSRAAVLLNQTGQPIIMLAYQWKYTAGDGQTFATKTFNLTSSMQTDVLSGLRPAGRDLWAFILPGSKRLITERGMYGDNGDVLPREELKRRGGGGGGRGMGGSVYGSRPGNEVESAELVLDAVVLENGLCAGPDEDGMIARLASDLRLQRSTAADAASRVRNGASAGEIFELLRPLARQLHGRPDTYTPIIGMFANNAIRLLVNNEQPEWLKWFEEIAQATPLELRRTQ